MALRSRARRGEPRSPARRHAAGNPGDTGGYASGRRHCRSGPNRLVCRTVPAVPGTADLRIVAPIREHEGGPVRVASIYDAVADSRTALRLRVTQRRTDLVLVSDSGGGALRPGCLWPRAHAVISPGRTSASPAACAPARPAPCASDPWPSARRSPASGAGEPVRRSVRTPERASGIPARVRTAGGPRSLSPACRTHYGPHHRARSAPSPDPPHTRAEASQRSDLNNPTDPVDPDTTLPVAPVRPARPLAGSVSLSGLP